MIDIPSHTLRLEKTNYAFLVGINYKKLLGWVCTLSLLSAGYLSGVNLWGSCVYCRSLCFVSRCYFLAIIYHPWLLQSFCLFFCIDPEPEIRDLIELSHLMMSKSKSLICAHCLVVGSCVNSHWLQEGTYLWKLNNALTYKYIHMSLGVILTFWSFSRIILVVFLFGSMTLVLVSWSLQKYQIWVPSHRMWLLYNQKVVGHSHNSCTTTALVCLSGTCFRACNWMI